jgi:hypothetical protein
VPVHQTSTPSLLGGFAGIVDPRAYAVKFDVVHSPGEYDIKPEVDAFASARVSGSGGVALAAASHWRGLPDPSTSCWVEAHRAVSRATWVSS